MKLLILGAACAVAVIAASGASAQATGESLFKVRCGACHGLAPAQGKMGPPLKGVVGRKSGSAPGYAYSDGMAAAKLAWTRANLDRFLAAPAKTVPGAKMMVAVPAADQRAAIIAYLAAQK